MWSPGLKPGQREAEHLRRLAGFHQRLVQSPRGRVAEDEVGERDAVAVRVQARGHLVGGHHDLHVALAADLELALAVLRGLHRPELGELAGGLRDLAERAGDEGERLRLVELAGHEEHRVVGLVVHPVERLEVLLLHVLDVAAVADGGAAVGVPVVGHALHALEHDLEGGVLAHLVFVAHDGELGVEVGLADEGVHHPVGLHLDGPLEVVVARLEELEVVGAVEPRGAVGARAADVELLVEVRVLRRALEHQVLEEVRHARLAVVLVPGRPRGR